MEQAQAFKQAGFDDLAAQTLTKYGLDSTMLDAWEGMSDTQKDKKPKCCTTVSATLPSIP